MANASKRHGLAIAEFCLAVRRFLRATEHVAARMGLHPIEYDLLLTLSAYPQGTASSIALLSERLLSQHHVAAGAAAKLAEKELVSTERNARDRRSVSLTVTDKGKSLLHEIALQTLRELAAHGPQMIESLSILMAGDHGALIAPLKSKAR